MHTNDNLSPANNNSLTFLQVLKLNLWPIAKKDNWLKSQSENVNQENLFRRF